MLATPMGWLLYGVRCESFLLWSRCFTAAKLAAFSTAVSSIVVWNGRRIFDNSLFMGRKRKMIVFWVHVRTADVTGRVSLLNVGSSVLLWACLLSQKRV